jgi:hypothetical protein
MNCLCYARRSFYTTELQKKTFISSKSNDVMKNSNDNGDLDNYIDFYMTYIVLKIWETINLLFIII